MLFRSRNEIRPVAEGVANVKEKLERFRQEVQEEFKELKSMIKFSYAELDQGALRILDWQFWTKEYCGSRIGDFEFLNSQSDFRNPN